MEPLVAKPHLIAALDAGDHIKKAGGVDAASHERRLRHERAERGGRTDPSDFLEDDPLDRLPRVRPRLDPVGDERLAVFTTNANHRAHAAYSHRTLSSVRVNTRATKRAASPGCTIHGSTPRSCGDSQSIRSRGVFAKKTRLCGLRRDFQLVNVTAGAAVTPPAASAARTAGCHRNGTDRARLACRSAPCRGCP